MGSRIAEFKIFCTMFPDMGNRVKLYSQMDKRSLKIELTNGRIYVFTYFDEKNWCLQTYKNYIESSKNTLDYRG